MTTSKNYDLYQSRNEPSVLAKLRSTSSSLHSYPGIRDIKDGKIIQALLAELAKLGEDYVILSWISPPYGKVIGYSFYTKREANILVNMSTKENWGFPRIGRSYFRQTLESRLKKLIETQQPL